MPKTETYIGVFFNLGDGDYSWEDDVEDTGIDHIVAELVGGRTFRKTDWEAIIQDLPLITERVLNSKKPTCKKPRKVCNVTENKGSKTAKVKFVDRMGKEKGKRTGEEMGEDESTGVNAEILREVERLNNEHTLDIQKLFAIEKQVLKSELYDDLLHALRQKEPYIRQSSPTTANEGSGGSKTPWGAFRVDVTGIIGSVNKMSTNKDIGSV